MENEREYFAFISYNREDEEWAIWLQHEIEYYHLPAFLNGREDLPKEFRPVFRDIDELKAGNLPNQIYEALASSINLIVICSPRSANSRWVNKEIDDFIELGRKNGKNNIKKIFPFIIEGVPHSNDVLQECFPIALRSLPSDEERVGGNVNESGRDKAFIKVMAGMLPLVSFDMLWNRYERDKAETERIRREERNKLLISQNRFITEKAYNLIEKGDSYTARLLLMEIMPVNVKEMDKPLTLESECALRIAFDQHSAVLKGHASSVHFVTFSPDGKQIVSASEDKTVRVWDVESGQPYFILEGHTKGVRSAVYSPDGKLIASASDDGTVIIWDSETGNRIRMLNGHTGIVFSAVFSPDGKQIVSASSDKTVRVWDVATGQSIHTLVGHKDMVFHAIFNPNGKQIITSSHDFSIIIWDSILGRPIRTVDLKRIKKVFQFANYCPDGKSIVFSQENIYNGDLIIWDITKGTRRMNRRNIRLLKGHTSQVNTAIFSFDGKRIVSASADEMVKIWDVNSGEVLLNLKGHTGWVSSAVFRPYGNQIASASFDNTIRIWDLGLENPNRTFKDSKSAAFSPNGKWFFSVSKDNIVSVWDGISLQFIRKMEEPIAAIHQASFSPNGKQIVSAFMDNSIRIFDAVSGQVVKVLEGQSKLSEKDQVINVSFSMDGKYIACMILSFLRADKVIVWDAVTGTIVRQRDLDFLVVKSSFSHDLSRIVSVSYSNTIKIWNAETGLELKSLMGHTDAVIFTTFTPDDKRIVSASWDGTVRIWDAETGLELKTLFCYAHYAAFSPDGKLIVFASNDNTIRIWDVESGKEMRKLEGHSDTVISVDFSPDGKRIISVSADNNVKIWDYLPLQDLLDQTRERFKDRPLTPEERHQYYLE